MTGETQPAVDLFWGVVALVIFLALLIAGPSGRRRGDDTRPD